MKKMTLFLSALFVAFGALGTEKAFAVANPKPRHTEHHNQQHYGAVRMAPAFSDQVKTASIIKRSEGPYRSHEGFERDHRRAELKRELRDFDRKDSMGIDQDTKLVQRMGASRYEPGLKKGDFYARQSDKKFLDSSKLKQEVFNPETLAMSKALRIKHDAIIREEQALAIKKEQQLKQEALMLEKKAVQDNPNAPANLGAGE